MTIAAIGGAGSTPWDRGIFEILFILIVFICILFLAYVATRFVAKRAVGRLKSRHIEVVDSLGVGADAQLMIIKVGEEFFLASKSQKQISYLSKLELTSEDIPEITTQLPGFAESFRTVLEGKLSRARPQRNNISDDQNVFRGNINRIKDLSDSTDSEPERSSYSDEGDD